jgi:hypothetical protein
MIGRIFAITFYSQSPPRESNSPPLDYRSSAPPSELGGPCDCRLMIADCGFGTSADIPNPHTAILNPQFFWWAGWESNPLPLDQKSKTHPDELPARLIACSGRDSNSDRALIWCLQGISLPLCQLSYRSKQITDAPVGSRTLLTGLRNRYFAIKASGAWCWRQDLNPR